MYPAVNEALGDTPAIPAVQRLYATVISEGTTGALVFDPPAVDFGSALVGSTTRVPLHLVNQSDCALSFKIEAVVEEELDGMDLDNDGIVEYHELKAYQARKVHACFVPSMFSESKPCVCLQAKAGVQSDANDESYDEGKGGDDDGIVVTARKPKATISFSPSHGSVPAHTKMTTYVAFVPPAAGKYVVRAFYEIHSLDDADALAKSEFSCRYSAFASSEVMPLCTVASWYATTRRPRKCFPESCDGLVGLHNSASQRSVGPHPASSSQR